jgi:cell division protein FtsL
VARPLVRSARQGRRLLVTTCTFLTIVLAFGVAASQVFVAQNQARIDHVHAQLKAEQARYDRLRFKVAELESPERIVEVAHDRLGMIEPAKVTYVAPVASNAPVATADDTAASDWRTVKSELASK